MERCDWIVILNRLILDGPNGQQGVMNDYHVISVDDGSGILTVEWVLHD